MNGFNGHQARPHVVCALILLATAGCASDTFRMDSLPAELAATPVRDFSSVNLTSVASQTVSEQRVQAGDRLEIFLSTGAWGEESEHTWAVGVDSNGQATLPNIGPVVLSGLTRTQAEQAIVQASLERDVFRTPAVDVRLKPRELPSTMVMGAVGLPGPLQIREANPTLADVLSRAGGLTVEASGVVSISGLSGSPATIAGESQPADARSINLYSMPVAELAQVRVPQGAVVMVEKAAPRKVQVIGVITNRSIDIPPGKNIRMLDAITMAGGPNYSGWILDKVYIIRQVPGTNETIRIRGSLRAAKKDINENPLLAADDIVSVEENPVTFSLSTLQAVFSLGTSGARLAAF